MTYEILGGEYVEDDDLDLVSGISRRKLEKMRKRAARKGMLKEMRGRRSKRGDSRAAAIRRLQSQRGMAPRRRQTSAARPTRAPGAPGMPGVRRRGPRERVLRQTPVKAVSLELKQRIEELQAEKVRALKEAKEEAKASLLAAQDEAAWALEDAQLAAEEAMALAREDAEEAAYYAQADIEYLEGQLADLAQGYHAMQSQHALELEAAMYEDDYYDPYEDDFGAFADDSYWIEEASPTFDPYGRYYDEDLTNI